jgi:transmembrane sensor
MQPPYDAPTNDDALAQRAAEDAARWLAALTDENCSDDEREQFFRWLRNSTLHVNEFLRVSTLARHAKRRDVWPADSIESLIAAAQGNSNVTTLEPRPSAPPAAPPRSAARWAIAASVAIAIGTTALLIRQPYFERLFDQSYLTATGEQRSVTLDDGSVVELNSQSRLLARLSEAERVVELTEGEAIFRVVRDPKRPFRVRTGVTEIVALGTAFNVNANQARTVVTVLEGRVRVSERVRGVPATGAAALIEDIELSMGEQLTVGVDIPAIRIALQDTGKVTSWTQRRLIFEDMTVSEAATEFARYSSRRIRIDDERIAARKITGVFDATDPASLVEFLRADETVEVRAERDGWVVRKR